MAPARSGPDGAIDSRSIVVGATIDSSAASPINTSYTVRGASFPIPSAIVAFACGSMSTSRAS